jgi:hypothetical protein
MRSASGDDKESERILAQCLASLGLSLSWNARQPEAEAATARAVTLAESLVARFPHETNLKQDLWRVYDSRRASMRKSTTRAVLSSPINPAK